MVVAVAAAVIAVAVVDAARPDGASTEPAGGLRDDDGSRLGGPETPLPGQLGGRLVVAIAEGCRPAVVDLDTARVGRPGPRLGCSLVVDPQGRRAVAPGASGDALVVVELGRRPAIDRELGPLVGSASWDDAGERVAWCAAPGGTSVTSLDEEAREGARVAGCDPRFSGGALLTRPDELFGKDVLREGAPYLDREEIGSALPSDADDLVSVLGYDAGGGGVLALVVVGVGPDDFVQQLQLWRAGRVERALELVRSPRAVVANVGDFGFAGKRVRVSPTGAEVAIGPPSSGPVRTTLVDLASGGRTLLPEASAFDWSPDGRWLALAEPDAVRIYGAERSTHVYALPLEARALAWRS